ncbi:MAG: hypothetical protein K8L97_07955 [Anaerolineae bacterium]|nr:hypothetical protein [Anaerolineae bacterium]
MAKSNSNPDTLLAFGTTLLFSYLTTRFKWLRAQKRLIPIAFFVFTWLFNRMNNDRNLKTRKADQDTSANLS